MCCSGDYLSNLMQIAQWIGKFNKEKREGERGRIFKRTKETKEREQEVEKEKTICVFVASSESHKINQSQGTNL